jgi:hypothetical protein
VSGEPASGQLQGERGGSVAASLAAWLLRGPGPGSSICTAANTATKIHEHQEIFIDNK